MNSNITNKNGILEKIYSSLLQLSNQDFILRFFSFSSSLNTSFLQDILSHPFFLHLIIFFSDTMKIHTRYFPFLSFFLLTLIVAVFGRGAIYTPPNVEKISDQFKRIPVNQGYNVFFGGSNVHMNNNGSNADLILDKTSGNFCQKKKRGFSFFLFFGPLYNAIFCPMIFHEFLFLYI